MLFPSDTVSGSEGGVTRNYAPPEWNQCLHWVDKQADLALGEDGRPRVVRTAAGDVFCFGATIVAALCNKEPLEGLCSTLFMVS